MTVKDLIEELQKVGNKDARVYFDDLDSCLTQVTTVTLKPLDDEVIVELS